MKKLLLIFFLLFSLSAISQIRIDQTKSVSSAGTIGIGKTIFANGSGGWTFETITIPTFDWKADTTWVLNKNYLQSETPQNLSLTGNVISLSESSATVDVSASTAVTANSAKVTNATHSGDATGSTALTVVGINNTNLAGLTTGILKNTTGSGTPSIATSSDFKTVNGTSVLGAGSITVGGGDVYKVGTPLDNQLGVWTGSGTIEGDAGLTFDTSTKTLQITGNTADLPYFRMKDADFPTRRFDQRFNTDNLSFVYYDGVSSYFPLTLQENGVKLGTIQSGTKTNILYYDTGTQMVSYGSVSASSGMADPMQNRGDIIYRNSSNVTDNLALGTSGTFLQSNGTDLIWGTAPAGSSQWTTQTYGITYASNVGIGTSSNASYKLNVLSSIASSPAAYIKNSSISGHGAWIYGGATTSEASLYVGNYDGSKTFLNIRGNGDTYMNELKEDASATNVLYYNPSTKELTQGAKPTGTGSGTVTSFSAGDISGLLTTTETNPTTTPALSFTLNNQAQNRIYASPYASSGTPTFRALDTNDLPNTAVTPGSYTASNITVDSKGRITAASSGSSGSGMVYPSGSGIPIVVSGTSWGTTITNNSANWNAAVTNMGKVKFYLGSTYNSLNSNDFQTSIDNISSINKTATPSSGSTALFTSGGAFTELASKQPTLVSGTNIRPVNGRTLLGSTDINDIVDQTSNTSFSLNVNVETNVRVITGNAITITITDIPIYDGETGNIEVIYTGSAVVTFDVPTVTNVYIASNIYNSTVDANTKTVLAKSSGSAIYSYYVSGNNIFIHGTQNYN